MAKIILIVLNFFNAIKKYGWDNFEHIILFENLTKEDADFRERQFIEIYDSIRSGYNLKTGGSRGELSEESLAKMSKSFKEGYIQYPERRAKISQNKSKPEYTEDLRNRMSKNNRNNAHITINDITGSIRWWAKFIKVSTGKLLYMHRTKGREVLIKFITEHLDNIK